jgi:hypothetical protein
LFGFETVTSRPLIRRTSFSVGMADTIPLDNRSWPGR